MIPQQNHPLTLAYIAGAKARTHEDMTRAVKLARGLEINASPVLLAQCKLAAEIILERKL